MSTDPTGLRPPADPRGDAGASSADERREPFLDWNSEQPADDQRSRSGARRTEQPEPEPKSQPRRSKRRGRKVRKVHRVVRHLDVWSIAKVATVFAACAYVVAMISGYLLWQAADRVGTIDGIEGFFEDAGGYDSFELLGDVVFRAAAVAGLLLAGLGVFVAVLGALLFNLISDLTGGVRMTVIDEDLIVAPAPRRGR